MKLAVEAPPLECPLEIEDGETVRVDMGALDVNKELALEAAARAASTTIASAAITNESDGGADAGDGDADTEASDPNEDERGDDEPMLSVTEYYVWFVAKTPEQCADELAAPQRTRKWKKARKPRITGSQFGTAAGLSPYGTPDQLVIEKIWDTFQGNAATEWGTEHEPDAKAAFTAWMRLWVHALHVKAGKTAEQAAAAAAGVVVEERGLMSYSERPYIGVSPDGIVRYTAPDGTEVVDLAEFKCPYFLKETERHPYGKWPSNTPPQYGAQVQGIMGYLNDHGGFSLRVGWFVVWQANQLWVTRLRFDAAYWATLSAKLDEWYFGKYLVAMTHKYNRLLQPGTATALPLLDIDRDDETDEETAEDNEEEKVTAAEADAAEEEEAAAGDKRKRGSAQSSRDGKKAKLDSGDDTADEAEGSRKRKRGAQEASTVSSPQDKRAKTDTKL